MSAVSLSQVVSIFTEKLRLDTRRKQKSLPCWRFPENIQNLGRKKTYVVFFKTKQNENAIVRLRSRLKTAATGLDGKLK